MKATIGIRCHREHQTAIIVSEVTAVTETLFSLVGQLEDAFLPQVRTAACNLTAHREIRARIQKAAAKPKLRSQKAAS